MKAFLEGMKALGAVRLASMGAVALAMLAMLAALSLHGATPPHMALLYSDLDLHEAGEIVDALDKAHIKHELGAQDDRIMVPVDQVAAARLLLAKSGLPSGGSVGYEIFDRSNNLTESQFEQTINQTRALEGELTRSIRLIAGVRAARVHLVLPKREPFAADQQPAQASVLLSMSGSGRLDPEGVQAVVTLVAAAVPGLKPQNIGVIDSHGNVLARAGEPLGTIGAATSIDELREATELRLARSVEEMLEPSLGADHVRAEAAVTMDVDQVRETDESYNPDQQVLRSQQTTTDKSRNTQADPSTSVQNNLPNADAGQTRSGSQDDKRDEVNNYEIGKTTRTLVQDQPRVARISLAVMVDGIPGRGGLAWIPRSPAELGQIETLVKGAIGFDGKRGDVVTVVSMPFAATLDEPAVGAKAGMFKMHFNEDDILRATQTALPVLFVVFALLFIIRPMVMRLTGGSVTTQGRFEGSGGRLEQDRLRQGAIAGPQEGSAAVALLNHQSAPGGGEETMVSIANIDGRLRASSIRQIVELVGSHPEESLSILRSWLGHEQEAG